MIKSILLTPLIFTNFSVLDKGITDFISSYSIRRDKTPHELFNEDLKIVIVEMSKLNKGYRELLDLKEKWCYILRESSDLTKQEFDYLSKNEDIKVALKHLQQLSRDDKLYQQALTEELNSVSYRLDKAGWIEEGIKEGALNKQKQIALKMLRKNVDISFISEMTGLSKREITQLGK